MTANVVTIKENLNRSTLDGHLKHFERPALMRMMMNPLSALFLALCLMFPLRVDAQELNWSLGGYVGQYYDSEPAFLIQGDGSFRNQYLVAITASKTIWRAQSLPLALEIDGMIGQQFGVDSLTEFAIAPVLRWSGFPWNDTLPTSIRFGPAGFSHTTKVSSLERNANGDGTHNLSFLLAELTFSRPQKKSEEYFVRMHHRSTIYSYLNQYGANGEDFLTLGFRRFF